MKKVIVLLLLFVVAASLLARTKPQPQAKPLAFTHVTVIDATGAPAKPDMTVLITGQRITAIGKTGKVSLPKEAQVVDATSKFLIPGLWDMHVHTASPLYLPLYVANGVTGVRDMGDYPDPINKLRKEVGDGTLLGPRIIAAGPIVDGPKPIWPFSIAVSSEAEGRKAVDDLKSQGWDFVKVYNLLPRDAYFAIADEAKRQGIPFAGHTPMSISVAEASNAGQKSIEHLTGVLLSCSTSEDDLRKEIAEALAKPDPNAAIRAIPRDRIKLQLDTFSQQKAAALLALLAKNQTWQVPTLTVLRAFASLNDPSFTNDPRLKYMPVFFRKFWDPKQDFRVKDWTEDDWALQRRSYQKAVELVGAMHRAGVPILAGTDTTNPYVFPGFSLHDELVLLVSAGLTPMEALQAATRNPAKYLGKFDSFGTIEQGKSADLVLLDENPLEDIAHTQEIRAVVINGRLLDRKALDELLAKAEAAGKTK